MSKESKFLSLVLRHKPEEIDLQLDEQGWALIDDLLRKMQKTGRNLTHQDLEEIVTTSDKKRFTISQDGLKIRAAQGHSINVSLGLQPQTPPSALYHGTAITTLDAIFAQGIISGKRQQVHLSSSPDTAEHVGQRHGKPAVLRIDCAAMHDAGHKFYRADNGVWLTDTVPAEFLSVVGSLHGKT